MKTLILLRHAKSGWDDPVARDFDRPLNGKGERAAAAMGAHVRALGIGFDRVVASPAVRVVETLLHFGTGYGRALDPDWDKRVYLASVETLLDIVHEQPETVDRVMLVGHNPGLEELILKLAPEGERGGLRDSVETKFPTASLAVLSIGRSWADAGTGLAELVRFERPRDLDPSLGPGQG